MTVALFLIATVWGIIFSIKLDAIAREAKWNRENTLAIRVVAEKCDNKGGS